LNKKIIIIQNNKPILLWQYFFKLVITLSIIWVFSEQAETISANPVPQLLHTQMSSPIGSSLKKKLEKIKPIQLNVLK